MPSISILYNLAEILGIHVKPHGIVNSSTETMINKEMKKKEHLDCIHRVAFCIFTQLPESNLLKTSGSNANLSD